MTEEKEVTRYMRLFAKRLEMARLNAGYESAEQFAKLLDIRPHAYRKYERGETQPKYELLLEIANYTRCTTDYLLSGKGRMPGK